MMEEILRSFNYLGIFEIQKSSVETIGAIVSKRTTLISEILLENIKLRYVGGFQLVDYLEATLSATPFYPCIYLASFTRVNVKSSPVQLVQSIPLLLSWMKHP
jgi:hypothetical protein